MCPRYVIFLKRNKLKLSLRAKTLLSAISTLLFVTGSLFLGTGIAHAVVVDNNNQPIAFANQSPVGTNANVGYTYRYANAVTIGSQVIDAIFTVTAKTSGGSISQSDESGAPNGATNEMINSTVNFAGSADTITYQLDFVEGGTSTPITLQNVAINVGDIDLLQFAQFAGITDYRLSSASVSPSSSISVLTPQTNSGSIPAGSYRFQSTSSSSTAADEENWVEVRYAQVNSIEIVLGATQSGGAYFSIDFKPALWPVAATVTTPTATPYTVTYDGNTNTGGTAPGATTATGSQTVLTNSGTLAKSGYTFAGWNTSPNGTGATYAAGSTIIPVSNVTLYALWVQGSGYTLSYNPNSAPLGSAPADTNGIGSVNIAPSAGTLSKPGYSFTGWNTAADGSGTTYQPGDALNLTSNITLYAMWTPALAQTGFETSTAMLAPMGVSLLALGFVLFSASKRLATSRRSNFIS